MTRYFTFLRAINVGGHTVKMDVLRQLFESLGFSNVETFIASGNVIFEAKTAAALNIGFLADTPEAVTKQKLISLKTDIDDFHIHGRELYWLCRKKQSESKVSNVVLEKTLGLKTTLRGINTINKMAEKYIAK